MKPIPDQTQIVINDDKTIYIPFFDTSGTEVDLLEVTSLLPRTTSFTVTVAGRQVKLNKVEIDSAVGRHFAVLHLDEQIVQNEAVSIEYRDRSSLDDASGVLQSATGRIDVDSFTLTPDTTQLTVLRPQINIDSNGDPEVTIVDPRQLTITFDQNISSVGVSNKNFVITAAGEVLRVKDVSSSNSTLTINLIDPILDHQAVAITYNDRSVKDDRIGVIEAKADGADVDTFTHNITDSGNLGASLPRLDSATVEVDGKTIALTFDQDLQGGSYLPKTSAFTVKVDGKVVKIDTTSIKLDPSDSKILQFELLDPVTSQQVVDVSYTDPTNRDDLTAIQSSGDFIDAKSFDLTAIDNNSSSTVPTLLKAEALATGKTIQLTFTDDLTLASSGTADLKKLAKSFTVKVDNKTVALDTSLTDFIKVNSGSNKIIELTLKESIAKGQTITVSYKDPSSKNDVLALQHATSYVDVASFNTAVTNKVLDARPLLMDVDLTATFNTTTKIVNDFTFTFDTQLDAPSNNPTTLSAKYKGKTVALTDVNLAAGTTNGTVSFDLDFSALKAADQPATTADLGKGNLVITYKDPKAADDTNYVLEGSSGLDVNSFSYTVYKDNTTTLTGSKTADFMVADAAASQTIVGGRGNDLIALEDTKTTQHTVKFEDSASANGLDTILNFDATGSGDVLSFGSFAVGLLEANPGTTTAFDPTTATAPVNTASKVVLVKADPSLVGVKEVQAYFDDNGDLFYDLTENLNTVVLVGDNTSDVEIYYVTGTSSGQEKVNLVGVLMDVDLANLTSANFSS